MFPFLETATIASSLFNTYASFRAQKEARDETIYTQKSNLAFAKKKKLKATQEYGAIVSYNVDMTRQKSLEDRQTLGANILNSGIAITPFDSAGLLLRHQAYHDEMFARAKETEYYHQRPKPNVNKDLVQHGISAIEKSAPFATLSTAVGGGIDLAKILNTIGKNNK
jgi:hypothetical protein